MEKIEKDYLPVLPIRNTVLYPGVSMPLLVKRTLSLNALKKAQEEKNTLLILTEKISGSSEPPNPENLPRIGTLSQIEKTQISKDNTIQVIVRGISRMWVSDLKKTGGLLIAKGETLVDKADVDRETAAGLRESVKSMALDILNLISGRTSEIESHLNSLEDLSILTDLCASSFNIPLIKKQELLETLSLRQRALSVLELMHYQKEFLKLQQEIGTKLSNKMSKKQREAILREQLAAIREELGEGGSSKKGQDYESRIEEAGMSEEVKKIALEEADRLNSLDNNSAESNVIRNYLDLLCVLPWSKSDSGRINLHHTQKVLNRDHYGLTKIKERILQHLAVMKLKKQTQGSILLFVGPPGVGKTSLGQSIAKALGRKYVRASLGGVRDEAEIRGHRRTYIGAMPGRIIQGIKRAGANNPVFVLDEIDKLGFGYSGDPASALLEVLDPEQNSAFLDHYLDVNFDLSKVFFIATANNLDTIPKPLLDRLEVIDVSGYTTAEKTHIAENHLVPKQRKTHGIKANQLDFTSEAILKIINGYTREAGVRELQRRIAEVCRGSSLKILKKPKGDTISIGRNEIKELLGVEKYHYETAESAVPPGVVTGLAWTPMGGDILFIEGTMMPGHGNLTLTGQLGDVMKESAKIAMSLVRSHLSSFLPKFRFNETDVHIHVPAGAIPKDGPSAGITIMTAIASLFTGIQVSTKIAMTGEITLRGAVMPIGGVKEKLLAANRAGIEHVILPSRNRKDLVEVAKDVLSELQVDFVGTAIDVLKVALKLNVDPIFSPHEVQSYPGIVGVN